jgi:hypothetical protein
LLQFDDPQQRPDAIQALLDELQGELFAWWPLKVIRH